MRTIVYRLKEKKKYCGERRFSEKTRNPVITGLEPNKVYELREKDCDWSRAQECMANDEGKISLYIYSEGFSCTAGG